MNGDCDRSDPTEDEVTPEMMEAGVLAWYEGNPLFYSREEIVTAIYRAMRKART